MRGSRARLDAGPPRRWSSRCSWCARRHPMIVPGPDVVQVVARRPADAPDGSIAPTPPPPERRAAAGDPGHPTERGGREARDAQAQRSRRSRAREAARRARSRRRASRCPRPRSAPRDSAARSRRRRGLRVHLLPVLVRNRIAQNWTPPAGLATGAAGARRRVLQDRARRLESRLRASSRPSGVEFFDRSALRAVIISDPLPPLPARLCRVASSACTSASSTLGHETAFPTARRWSLLARPGRRLAHAQTGDVRIDISSGQGRRIRVLCESLGRGGDRNARASSVQADEVLAARSRALRRVHGEPLVGVGAAAGATSRRWSAGSGR